MKIAFFLILPLFILSCDKTPEDEQFPKQVPSEPGIYILNEGIWGQNNSSLQFFSVTTGLLSGDLKTGVLGEPLGDTGNSMTIDGGFGLISVTSSNKLVWFDLNSGTIKKSYKFSSDSSPRESLIGPDGMIYISSFYQHQILVINPSTQNVIKFIPVDQYPENLASDGENLYVSCNGMGSGRTVLKIPFQNAEAIISISVPQNPDKLVSSPTGLLVYCQGNLWEAKPKSRIVKIDRISNMISDSLDPEMPVKSVCEAGSGKISVTTDDAVFIVNSDLSITDTLVDRKKLNFKGKIVYQTCFDAKTGWFWVTTTDAYTVRGWLEAFHNGNRVAGPVQVGINPGSLLVKP